MRTVMTTARAVTRARVATITARATRATATGTTITAVAMETATATATSQLTTSGACLREGPALRGLLRFRGSGHRVTARAGDRAGAECEAQPEERGAGSAAEGTSGA